MKSACPGVVDEVHRRAVDGERRHGGADRDAAFALERQRVGLRRPGVDAADRLERAGGVQQAFVSDVLPASTCATIPRFKRRNRPVLSHPSRGEGHRRLAHQGLPVRSDGDDSPPDFSRRPVASLPLER
jgi:hypothetical protein